MSIFISVIVPAKNEEKMLPGTLAALKAQNFDKSRFEIILVDNGSTDGTVNVAKDANVKVLQCPGINVGAMRNRGAQIANGEVFAFIDADCIANLNWLSRIYEIYSNERCVTGAACDIADDDTWIAKAWFYLQPKKLVLVKYLATNNMIVDRATFDQICGFNEKLVSGEDYEFCLRASQIVPVVADPALKVVHLGTPKTTYQFFRREVWHGIGAFGTFKHLKWNKPLIGTILFSLSSLSIVFGIILSLFNSNGRPFYLAGLFSIALLLLLTINHRRNRIRDFEHALQLAYLYFYFYLGRTVALLLMLVPGDYYHNNRTRI